MTLAEPAVHPSTPPLEPVLIRPSRGWVGLRLGELWDYRELLYFLAWRDVKVRYKHTALGAAWAIVQPVLTTVVFTIFFGTVANVGSEGLPYPLFSYAGILPWTFFANAISQAAGSLTGAASMLKKVYYPRLVTPIAAVFSGMLDFAVAFGVLFVLMGWYRVAPSWTALAALPLFSLLALAAALGAGLWLAALNTEYRDVRYVVPFFVQLWLFVTPVIYPASKVTGKLEELGLPGWLYGLNPMAAVVQGFRWSLLRAAPPAPSLVAAGALVSAGVLVSGLFYFRRTERLFSDLL
jgi:homopolymeric O-antigen transport system permease protein